MADFLKTAWAFLNRDIPASKLTLLSNIAGFLGLWIGISALFNNLTDYKWMIMAALLGVISLIGLVASLQEWASKQGANRLTANVVVIASIIIIVLIMTVPQFLGLVGVS